MPWTRFATVIGDDTSEFAGGNALGAGPFRHEADEAHVARKASRLFCTPRQKLRQAGVIKGGKEKKKKSKSRKLEDRSAEF